MTVHVHLIYIHQSFESSQDVKLQKNAICTLMIKCRHLTFFDAAITWSQFVTLQQSQFDSLPRFLKKV
jgi:hypothetical protein